MTVDTTLRNKSVAAPAAGPNKGGTDPLAAVRSLLEDNRVRDAIALLNDDASMGSADVGQRSALLGKGHFRAEQYPEAVQHLTAAIERDPDNEDLRALRKLAQDNVKSDIVVDRTLAIVDLAKLMGPPQPGNVQGVVPPPQPRRRFSFSNAAHKAGRLAVLTTSAVIGGVLGVACRMFGNEKKGEVWTTWSHHGMAKAMLMLEHTRNKLNRNNLVSPYPAGQLVGFLPQGMKAPDWALHNRTYDGSFNDLSNPKAGASGTRFTRNVALEATRVDPSTLLDPNPRELSRVFGTRENGQPKRLQIANQLLGMWIQFMVHDWVDAGDPVLTGELHKIPLAEDDPKRKELHMTHMLVGQTANDPTRRAEDGNAPRTFINHATSWWDGSQLYGNDEATTRSLRSGVDGKLTLDANGYLPVDASGLEKTGVRRNFWVGLASLHTVFAREHNRICDMLKSHHPDWSDEQLFLKARMGVAAIMAKIHTLEWTPAVLANKKLNLAMHINWYGALETKLKDPEHRKTLPWYKLADEVVGGIVGNATQISKTAYGLSMEFLDVYRLHSLLLDTYPVYDVGAQQPKGEFTLAESRMKGSHQIMEKEGLARLLYSFGKEGACALTLGNYPKTLQNLSVPGFGFYDLMAVDILRARERGVPRYNEMRRQLGLTPITCFEDLTDDPQQVADLKRMYKGDIEKIDMLIGTLAEAHRPEGYGFGETLFQIFILNASLRLHADRFFTKNYNAETYTQELLDYIDQSTFKSVLQNNVPELVGTDLDKMINGFEIWDPDGIANKDRHPLQHAAKVSSMFK